LTGRAYGRLLVLRGACGLKGGAPFQRTAMKEWNEMVAKAFGIGIIE
jgi:hypothetical protein